MCGIVGAVGDQNLVPAVFEGLKKLEYRGYDSAGIACINGNGFSSVKRVGKISELEKALLTHSLSGNTIISQSRWATHGQVSEENAHPHFDCTHKVAVVHNGIIENYAQLRKELESRGHKFASETDTETIPHLIEEELSFGKSFEESVAASLQKLEGSYALLAMHAGEEGKIIAAKKESPLLIGLGKNTTFAASDSIPLAGKADSMIILEEGQYAVLAKSGAKVYDSKTGASVAFETRKVDLAASDSSKGMFEHFMLKEILDQPQAVRLAAAQDKKMFEDIAGEIVRTERVMFVACGTSRHAALVGRYLFNKMAEKYCDVMIGSEFSYFAGETNRKTLIVAISQSGETADVLDGVRKAKEKGARIFCIVNTKNSSLDRLSDKSIHLTCGPEISVAATKSFVNQLAIFYLLAYAAAGKFNEGKEMLLQAAQTLQQTIDDNDGLCKKIAKKISRAPAAYFIARGINFAIALEGALKMKEITYIHAEGMPAGELKHGTLALVEKATPVIAINPQDYTFFETQSNAMETKARGAFLIGLTDSHDENTKIYDEVLKIPKTNPLWYPFHAVVPLQLLAYYTAVEKGTDPDKPRNLAKSVTVK